VGIKELLKLLHDLLGMMETGSARFKIDGKEIYISITNESEER